MPRRFVNELAHQETIDQVFLAADKQLRPNRNGNLYLQVDLSDRFGHDQRADVERLRGRLQRLPERRLRPRRRGHATVPGAVQLIATRLTKVDPGEVNADDFLPLGGSGGR